MVMKVFLDSASIDDMEKYASAVEGFTTNPSLMRQAGVQDYERWGREVLSRFPNHSISMEVVTDDPGEMERQGKLIASWGANVFVKIPICTSTGEPTAKVIKRLSGAGVRVNVTAVMTRQQVKAAIRALDKKARAIISVFAGRIEDTGTDPRGVVTLAVRLSRQYRGFDVLWASTRSVRDISVAGTRGVDIITLTRPIMDKLNVIGRDLHQYSVETVKQFYTDATLSGYTL